jgi:hypothetical protein
MNLQENIQRIKEMMGLNEKIEVDDDSYVTMNIKNFPKYKEEVSDLLKDKLNNSNGDFVTFKNSVIVGYDQNGTPILSDDLNIDNRYLNYMVSMGSKKFNSLLYSIFSDFYGTEVKSNKTKSEVINCDPSNFEISGPIVSQKDGDLSRFWASEKGAQVYFVKLPKDCLEQLSAGPSYEELPKWNKETRKYEGGKITNPRLIYVNVEPNENRVHFPMGISEKLRGKKLGTLIYLAMIKKLGYITSSMGNSPEIKMVYQDILTNPKYQEDVMSLLLQKQVIIFDRNTNLDVKQIFNEFVSGKFTDKKSVRISPALQEILGDDYTNWYNSLEESPEQSIKDKIEKYKDLEPKWGDTVVDTTTNKIYSFNGQWKEKDGNEKISLMSDKYESLLLPVEEKKRFKVIHRQFN